MKVTAFHIACVSLAAAAAAAACADSQEVVTPPPDTVDVPDTGPSVLPPPPDKDAGPGDAEAGPMCSPAGWCNMPLPDTFLSVVDLWPLASRAFVVAKSPFAGVRVLEATGALGQWTYIDDGSQNEDDVRGAPTNLWAPSDDEVYYALASGYVLHGKRPAPPATAWTWTRDHFTACDSGGPWVWGTSAKDVYVGSCNTIYHRSSDADAGAGGGDLGDGGEAGVADSGAPGWVAEHVETDPTNEVFFLGASGPGPDDVWFSGVRKPKSGGACTLVLRRTPAGYERIADSVPGASTCKAQPGLIFLGGPLESVQSPAKDQILGLLSGRTPTKIAPSGDGGYSYTFAKGMPGAVWPPWTSGWAASADELWLGADVTTGQVVHGTNLWSDAGAVYQFSSIALNGAAILSPIVRVRGTSSTNLWAAGGSYVLHKTTP